MIKCESELLRILKGINLIRIRLLLILGEISLFIIHIPHIYINLDSLIDNVIIEFLSFVDVLFLLLFLCHHLLFFNPLFLSFKFIPFFLLVFYALSILNLFLIKLLNLIMNLIFLVDNALI